MSSRDDWTVPVDDLLVERWGGCTGCGRWPLDHAGIQAVDGLAIAVSLCGRCYRQDPQYQRVDAMLAERYHSAHAFAMVKRVKYIKKNCNEKEHLMDQKERDLLKLFIYAVVDAGVTGHARDDAVARLETHFAGHEPDAIDVHSYARGDLRRQAPHFWRQDTPGMPRTSLPDPTARDVRKGAAPVEVHLTEEEQTKLPTERLTIIREKQAAAARRQP